MDREKINVDELLITKQQFQSKIFCIGGANIDYKLKSISALELATSNPVSSNTTCGGVARNVAENLVNLTDNIYLQCVVGGDDDGKRLLQYAQQKGINTLGSLILEGEATSRYYAILDQAGELYVALAAMDIYDDIPFDSFVSVWKWPDNSIIFMDTNLPSEILDYAIQLSKNQTFKLCLDPVSVLKSKKIPYSLDGVFLIKPDQYEAQILTGMTLTSVQDCMKAGEILLNRGVQNVVITLGKFGYVIVNQEKRAYFKSIPVNTITDVSGAGDAFFAGMLVGLQYDFDIEHACHFGAAAAARTIQSYQSVVENISLSDLIMQLNHPTHEENDYATIF